MQEDYPYNPQRMGENLSSFKTYRGGLYSRSMKKIAIISLLALNACGMNEYHPAVKQNMDAKYERDLKECIQYSKDIRSKPDFPRSIILGSTGLIGLFALHAVSEPRDNGSKDGYELTNDCLKDKGYDLE